MTTNASSGRERRLRERALEYLGAGQLVPAQATLETLRQRVPQDASVHLALGNILLRRGLPQPAHDAFLEAAELASARPALAPELVQGLLEAGASRRALELMETLAEHLPGSKQERLALAQAWQLLGETGRALALVEGALEAADELPDRHFFHGLLKQYSGDLAGAGEIFERCLARWPAHSGAALERARLRRQTPASNHVADLRQRQDAAPAESFARAELGFALFKELDDLGRYDEAWTALVEANAIMRRRNPYDAEAVQATTDAILRNPYAAGPAARRADDDPQPVFIVGLPRSGTTLLDRMLSRHSAIVSAGELADFHRQLRRLVNIGGGDPASELRLFAAAATVDAEELGGRYLAETRWRARGHRFFIDKLPANLQLVGLIHQALPAAPIIFLEREPVATCFSHLKASFGDGFSAYSYGQNDVAHHFGEQMRLVEHWRELLPEAFHTVRYADLVLEPEQTIRAALEFCGLDFEAGCADPAGHAGAVETLSTAQVREGIHTRGLGDWTHYAAQLAPLRAALQALGFDSELPG